MEFTSDFHFVYRPGNTSGSTPSSNSGRPLLLLHGTGGNEHDLLDLAATVAPGRAVISPRGKVLEHGMPRFFKRLAEGVFDEADLRQRTAELAEFVTGICAHNGLAAPIALGFSNGANIAAALLTLRPEVLSGAILLRAMAPLKEMPRFTLPKTPVLLVSGRHDTMIPFTQAERLAAALKEAGATLTHEILPAGHGLTQTDLSLMSRFLAAQE